MLGYWAVDVLKGMELPCPVFGVFILFPSDRTAFGLNQNTYTYKIHINLTFNKYI